MIENALQVEVFRCMVDNNPLVGTYCILNNNGGLVNPEINQADLEDLSTLIQIPLTVSTNLLLIEVKAFKGALGGFWQMKVESPI